MIGTDRYAYVSPLRSVEPRAKLLMSTLSVVLCLCARSALVSVATILFFSILLASAGRISLHKMGHLLSGPFWFLLVGSVTIVLTRCPDLESALVGVTLGGRVYGITKASLAAGIRLILRALSVVASVYFTVLTTPVTDLFPTLRRLHVPGLFISLMEMIYRFIFVLYETAQHIHTAQESRLGYDGLRRSYHSMGTLLSTVFIRAYRRSDNIYNALESRGYEGEMNVLSHPYESGKRVYCWSAGLCVIQVALLIAERRLGF